MGRPPRDPRLVWVLRERAAIRATYQDALEAQMAAADAATRGNLLGQRAPEHARHADLWLRNEATGMAWASEELRDWWREHGRLTWRAFCVSRMPYDVPWDRSWGDVFSDLWGQP